MTDFYCDEVLSGRVRVEKVMETVRVLAFHHTRPSYPAHIVVIPKQHFASLLDLGPADDALLVEMMSVVREVSATILAEHGACRVITNLGTYQDSKHLHWHIISGEQSLRE